MEQQLNDQITVTFGLNLQSILLLCIIIILIILFFIFKYSIPKYLEQKGANYANKQDIEKLTLIVKNIEHTFIEKTEVLKTKLGMASQLNILLHNEERSSLINLHNNFYEYSDFITDLTIGNIDLKIQSEIDKCEIQHELLYKKLFRSKASVMLFIDDEQKEIEDKVTELGILLLEKTTLNFYKYLHDIKLLNLKYKNLDNKEKIDEYFDKRKMLTNDRKENLKETIEVLGPKLRQLSTLIKNYLYEKTQTD